MLYIDDHNIFVSLVIEVDVSFDNRVFAPESVEVTVTP